VALLHLPGRKTLPQVTKPVWFTLIGNKGVQTHR